MFSEFRGDLEWRGHPLAHSKYHQMFGGRYGVQACHIVQYGDVKGDQEKQNLASENQPRNISNKGFGALRKSP